MDSIFQPGSISTTICNSTLHELWSYGDKEKTVRAYLREKFKQLEPGGRLVIRDVTGPEEKEQEISLWCNRRDGANPSARELKTHARTKDWLESLSTHARFQVFTHDFKPHKVRSKETTKGITLSLQDAAEFISKKDYTDNWKSEMHEEFCFWSFSQWQAELRAAGFSLREDSQAFTNPWTVENRYKGKVSIRNKGKVTPWPPTNMLLIAEKPAAS